MTFINVIWKIERILIQAKCSKCSYYMGVNKKCLIFERDYGADSNCMYYEKETSIICKLIRKIKYYLLLRRTKKVRE